LPTGEGGAQTTQAPETTQSPETTEAPETTQATEAPETTEAPPATEAPAEPGDEGTDDEGVPIWVWVLGAVALVALGAAVFRPRRDTAPPPVAAPAATAPVDPGRKADAYADGRWLLDTLTAPLADFKAELEAGRIEDPGPSDARAQALAAIGDRTVAAQTSLSRLEATATNEAARGTIVAAADALSALRRAFDGYATARARSIAGEGADLGGAATQLDTARKVLSAALESVRNL
jgi:hypothetical protein